MLNPETVATKIRALIDQLGNSHRAARAVGVSETTISKCAAALRVRPATLLFVASRLAELEADPPNTVAQ